MVNIMSATSSCTAIVPQGYWKTTSIPSPKTAQDKAKDRMARIAAHINPKAIDYAKSLGLLAPLANAHGLLFHVTSFLDMSGQACMIRTCINANRNRNWIQTHLRLGKTFPVNRINTLQNCEAFFAGSFVRVQRIEIVHEISLEALRNIGRCIQKGRLFSLIATDRPLNEHLEEALVCFLNGAKSLTKFQAFEISEEGLIHLTSCKNLGSLDLSMFASAMTGQLASLKFFSNLSDLEELSLPAFTAEQYAAFAQVCPPSITDLDFYAQSLEDEHLLQLFRRLLKLQKLALRITGHTRSGLSDKTLEALPTLCPKLRHLELESVMHRKYSRMTKEGLIYALSRLQLSSLMLWYCEISDAVFETIAKHQRKSLNRLTICGCSGYSDEAVMKVGDVCRRLVYVRIASFPLGKKAHERHDLLQSHFPEHCILSTGGLSLYQDPLVRITASSDESS